MCGICGIYQYAREVGHEADREGAAAAQVLPRMLEMLHHRGPDGEGVYLGDGLALGMRRLSIIDLAGGDQPICTEDKQTAIIFNGEIYNYVELTRQLQARGHQFSTHSDTEVIVHLYEELGEGCVEALRGMFAFAVWDAHRRRLLLARDRLGIKPLYYTQQNGTLIFASEIKSLLQHPTVQARPNLEALGNYLTLKYVPAPQTLFAGIRSLPPGHLLSCDASGAKVRPYWDLSFSIQDAGRGEDEYSEELEQLLRESVRLHLVSDVPFGAFLSGGVDSSTVVALMSQLLDEPVKTFSVGFESGGLDADELPYARLVAQQFGTDHHEIVVRPHDLPALAEKVLWHLDQPIADQATIATYMVSKLAAQHVKMVLTGEGGDELFAGYARYAGEQWSPLFRRVPTPIKTAMLAASERVPGLRRPKIALHALCQPDEVTRFANWFPLFNSDMKRSLLSAALADSLQNASTDDIFAYHLGHTDARLSLNRMLYVDTKLWLPDYLMLRGDKLSMAASLEARVPLLDHKLVEFAAALPPHLKLKGLIRKYLLKRVSRRWLPEQIVHRKKAGFPMSIARWIRGEMRPFAHDLLSPALIRKRDLFNEMYVNRLLSEHEKGFADHSVLLWSLMNVELWYRLFVDSSTYVRQTRARLPA